MSPRNGKMRTQIIGNCLIAGDKLRSNQGIRSVNGWFELILEIGGDLVVRVVDTPLELWRGKGADEIGWRRSLNDGSVLIVGGEETVVLLDNNGNLAHVSPAKQVPLSGDSEVLEYSTELTLWESGTNLMADASAIHMRVFLDFGPEAQFFDMGVDSTELADVQISNQSDCKVTILAGGEERTVSASLANVVRLRISDKQHAEQRREFVTGDATHRVVQPMLTLTSDRGFWPADYIINSAGKFVLRKREGEFFYRQPGREAFLDMFWTSPDPIAFPDTAMACFSAVSHELCRHLGGFRSSQPADQHPVQACDYIAATEGDYEGLNGVFGNRMVRDGRKTGVLCFRTYFFSRLRLDDG